jgi:hypothetical protein
MEGKLPQVEQLLQEHMIAIEIGEAYTEWNRQQRLGDQLYPYWPRNWSISLK